MPENKKEKIITIIINGEEKNVKKEKLSYEDIVVLAFGNYIESATTIYTITYTRGKNEKPNGVLVKGQTIMIKKEMIFNVSRTNRS